MGTSNSTTKYDSFSSQLFLEIGLRNKDIQILTSEFDKINISGSGKISRREFYTTFGYDETVCIKKLFLLCSKNDATSLDFSEFVCLVWNFLTVELADVVPLLFHLYDTDVTGENISSVASNFLLLCSGTLKVSEIQEMIREMHPVRYKNSTHLQKTTKRLENTYQHLDLSLSDFRLQYNLSRVMAVTSLIF